MTYDSEDIESTLRWNDDDEDDDDEDDNDSNLSFIFNQSLPYAHAVPVSPTYSNVQVAKPINTTYTTYTNSYPIPFINTVFPSSYHPLSRYRIKKIHKQKYFDKMYNNSYSKLETLSETSDNFFDEYESDTKEKKSSKKKSSKKKGSKKKKR